MYLLGGATVGIIVLWAVWTALHRVHPGAKVQQAASIIPESPPAVVAPAAVGSPPAASRPAAAGIPATAGTPNASSAAPLPAVLHQEIPDVSRSARESIRGDIRIAVRVTVDRSGNVAAATLNKRASSQYFTRAAMDAAKKWKFAQAADDASRAWLLHFEFTRAGATVHAVPLRTGGT
jgi:TonB family protein